MQCLFVCFISPQALCTVSRVPVALKIYDLTKLTGFLTYQVYREVEVHSRMSHPHAVQLFAAFRVRRTAPMH